MTKKRTPLHPGEFIKRVYIEEAGLTASAIAEGLRVNKGTFSRLLRGLNDVTPAMALKLSAVLGRSAQSWMNMQSAHSLAKAELEAVENKWSPAKAFVGGEMKPAMKV